MYHQAHALLKYSMASSSSGLSAKELQEQYGDVLAQPPLSDSPSPYLLHQALTTRQPPIPVSYAAVRTWYGKYRVAPGAQSVATAKDLEEKYGHSIRHLAVQNNTPYKLCKALRLLDPPLHVQDSVAKTWLRQYALGEIMYLESAGHLESLYGASIREHGPFDTGDALVKWLFENKAVCYTLLNRSTSVLEFAL